MFLFKRPNVLLVQQIFFVCAGKKQIAPPDGKEVDKVFVATVSVIAMYLRRTKDSLKTVSDSTTLMVMMFLILYINRSLSLTQTHLQHQTPPAMPRITTIKLLCTMQWPVMVLLFTFMLLWHVYSLCRMCCKHWTEDKDFDLTLIFWVFFTPVKVLALLSAVFFSLSGWLQSLMIKMTFFSVIIHVQLATRVQNSRAPTKCELVIRIHRLT